MATTDPVETLKEALERSLLKVKHDPAMLLLDPTLGEVLDVPSDSRKTRIPRRWKCSQRGWRMQL